MPFNNRIADSGGNSGDVLSILQDQGEITSEQAELVKRRVKRANVSAQQAINDLGLSSEEAVYKALAKSGGLEFVRLREQEIDEKASEKVSTKVAFHYNLVPIKLENQTLTAAIAEQLPMREREQLRMLLGVRLKPVIATPSDIKRFLKQQHGVGADTVMEIRKDRNIKQSSDSLNFDGFRSEDLAGGGEDDAEAASITRLVNQLLREALDVGATDIHIEPMEDRTRVRYRIDGMLREVTTPPGLRELHRAVVSRMKIMANLDIAEQRLPHDGRIRVNVGDEGFDLRVSILPTRFGETLCLRILNRSAIFLQLSDLGLNDWQYEILTGLVELPHGIILVTGPTGSGKTTTLYACLARVRYSERKIITVEDPVEYQLDGTSQIQMHSEIGLTFARGLRSILRHDPDIILVGEIRDSETAEIAIRSSLTGHLVLSTLHTNDAVGAVNRLVDMEVEPYLVASSLLASIAQRLVRRICKHCKQSDSKLDSEIRKEIAESSGKKAEAVNAWVGDGCPECDDCGYRGRVAIYELFVMNEELEDMISMGAKTSELRRKALEHGMKNLRDDGWTKVMDGLTTIEEVTRITGRMKLTEVAT